MKSFIRSWALAAFALVGAAAPSFAGITYNVTNYAEGQNGWSVNGTITASGVGTYTDASAITAWDITLAERSTGSYQFTNTESGHDRIYLGGTLIASTSTLDLSGYGMAFKSQDDSNQIAWSPYYQQYNGLLHYQTVFVGSGFSPSNNGVWTIGTATSSAVPEIDPATGGSALSLVAGVLAMVEQRRRRSLKAGLAG